ncbi:MAG TPA: helix-turn-helix transcriptional regulator [Trebonia sp.]|nr:helix-turn-helix transcriptional regulator [Trebonia sp.]
MATSSNPVTPRHMLGSELRTAREGTGLTREQAAKTIGFSLSKLLRIEGGEQGVSPVDLRALLELYDVTDEERVAELGRLARESRRKSWWSRYRDYISRQFAQLLGLEGAALLIRVFHPLLIPALLQTSEYAFELLRPRTGEAKARELTHLRVERQAQLFGRAEPPAMRFVFGEEALLRPIGSPEIMKRQLRRLLELADEPSVSIRIVPINAGAHPGLSGSFILLDLNETEILLFLEGAAANLVIRDDKDQIEPFIGYFTTLTDLALSEKDTRSLISRTLEAPGWLD